MRVSEYEYDYVDEDKNVSEKRKNKLIKAMKNEIRKDAIAHCRVLKFGKSDEEYKFMYDWLDKNNIQIIGINDTINGQIDNFTYVGRSTKKIEEDKLEEEEQERLLRRLNELKNSQDNVENVEEYKRIRDELVIHNMKLAKWVSKWKKIKEIDLPEDDKEQIAMLNLMRAVDNFDINKDYKFSTYATRVIYRGIIADYYGKSFREFHLSNELKKIEEFENEMLKELNREPNNVEIANMLGTNEEHIKKLISYKLKENQSSLDSILEQDSINISDGIYVDDEKNIYSSMGDETSNKAMIYSCQRDIKLILGNMLDERSKKIISMHFGLDGYTPQSSEQIAKYFNISSTRVLQIEHDAFERIKKYRKTKGLKDYINEFETKGEEK